MNLPKKCLILQNHSYSWGSVCVCSQNFSGLWGRNFLERVIWIILKINKQMNPYTFDWMLIRWQGLSTKATYTGTPRTMMTHGKVYLT